MMFPSKSKFYCLLATATIVPGTAFQPTPRASLSSPTALSMSTTSNESSNSRRQLLFSALTAAVTATTCNVAPAAASYSAYTNREKDWQERVEKGQIQITTARSLKSQLREIAPMNTERSTIFCPNGPSAAVSPLMENKCGDRLATPSVYGRTQDVVGNSIPGFAGGLYTAGGSGGGDLSAADVGGFPSYKF